MKLLTRFNNVPIASSDIWKRDRKSKLTEKVFPCLQKSRVPATAQSQAKETRLRKRNPELGDPFYYKRLHLVSNTDIELGINSGFCCAIPRLKSY